MVKEEKIFFIIIIRGLKPVQGHCRTAEIPLILPISGQFQLATRFWFQIPNSLSDAKDNEITCFKSEELEVLRMLRSNGKYPGTPDED